MSGVFNDLLLAHSSLRKDFFNKNIRNLENLGIVPFKNHCPNIFKMSFEYFHLPRFYEKGQKKEKKVNTFEI